MFENIDVGLIYLLVICAVFAVILVCMVITLAQRFFGRKRRNEETPYEPKVKVIPALVLDGRNEMVYYHRSPRFPRHYLAYFLTFRTEDGRVVEYEVPKHIFEYGMKHRKGMLVLSEDRFFDYGQGQDI